MAQPSLCLCDDIQAARLAVGPPAGALDTTSAALVRQSLRPPTVPTTDCSRSEVQPK